MAVQIAETLAVGLLLLLSLRTVREFVSRPSGVTRVRNHIALEEQLKVFFFIFHNTYILVIFIFTLQMFKQ